MKLSSLAALSALLTQTTALWAMDRSDFPTNMEQLERCFFSIVAHKPPASLSAQKHPLSPLGFTKDKGSRYKC